MKRLLSAIVLSLAGMHAAWAQQPVKIVGLMELSGPGATSGSHFKAGLELATKEINAAGGILGRRIALEINDTQTNPGVAKALVMKAADADAFAVFGPIFSGSVLVSMEEAKRAEIPNFVGGEATAITQRGNPFVFRTSFSQAPALRARQSNADVLFAYLTVDESARLLRELKKQGYGKPVIGETTIMQQSVIDLAGEAANGARGHVGLTIDAPNPAIRAFAEKFERDNKFKSSHEGLKAYIGMYTLKAVTEKVGRFDRKAVAQAMKGLALTAKQYPGVLMDLAYDENGDLDRESFMVEVKSGKQVAVKVLPPLGRK